MQFIVGLIVNCVNNSVMGRVAALTSSVESNKSPIQRDLECFMTYCSIFASLLGTTLGIMAFLLGYSWIDSLLFLIGIVVANVPEGTVLLFYHMNLKSSSR